MRYKALRTICGDYGPGGTSRTVRSGETFEVPEYRVRQLLRLESKGIIMRDQPRPKIDRKAYTVYENKAVAAPENKAVTPEENKQPPAAHPAIEQSSDDDARSYAEQEAHQNAWRTKRKRRHG